MSELMKSLKQDIRYAFRMLGRNPGFSIIAILTLALGIGANTAIFSVINELMLRPLPYYEAQNLFRINRAGVSYVDLQDIAERSHSHQQLAGYREQSFDLTSSAEPERFQGALVTGSLFGLLGAKTDQGRLINISDDKKGAPRIVVITHEFWKTRLGSSSNALNSSIPFGGVSYVIVGILKPGFGVPRLDAQIFAPMAAESPEEAGARGAHSLVGLMRLKSGISHAQAQAEFNAIAKDLQKLDPEENNGLELTLLPLQEHLVRNIRPALFLLLGAVALVLLIAGANVGGLLMARSASRTREFAVRAALGAGRLRIIRQLLVEYLSLALAGGLIGIFLSIWIADVVLRLSPETFLQIESIHLDRSVFLFTAAVSILTGLIFGMVPAFQASKADPFTALKENRQAGRRGAHAFRNALVVTELVLAIILLIGSGLLLRSFYNLTGVEVGFDSKNLTTLNLTPDIKSYGDVEKRTRLFDQFLTRVRSLPGIESAALTSELPFGPGGIFHNFVIEGRPPQAVGTEPEIFNRSISPEYFRTLKVPFKAGRDFAAQDHSKGLPVVIINEQMARTYFPNENPIGKRVKWARDDEAPWLTIIGVAGDVHASSLDSKEVPALYTPFTQEVRFWKTWMNVVIRSKVQPASVGAAVRKELASLDRTIPLTDLRTMDEWISLSVADRKFNLLLIGSFAALALILSSLGLYGLISFTVAERTNELGVRMALGAQKRDIVTLIAGQSIRLAIFGVVLGLILSFAATRLIQQMLYGVKSSDPITLAAVCILLTATAIAASIGPALRAVKLDPATTLRYE
jgi:putative ABC transport system permease protein